MRSGFEWEMFNLGRGREELVWLAPMVDPLGSAAGGVRGRITRGTLGYKQGAVPGVV